MIRYLYSVARLFLIKRIEDTKYIPIISDRKRTTLLEDPLPTRETAKKNCTQAIIADQEEIRYVNQFTTCSHFYDHRCHPCQKEQRCIVECNSQSAQRLFPVILFIIVINTVIKTYQTLLIFNLYNSSKHEMQHK